MQHNRALAIDMHPVSRTRVPIQFGEGCVPIDDRERITASSDVEPHVNVSAHEAGSLWVVVPARDEMRAIAGVVASLRSEGYRVVVVDDGSTDATAETARRAGATVLRHCHNLGQGAALQTGITFSLRSGAKFICTFDADGQHCAEDILSMWKVLCEEGVDIVLGSRFLGESPGMTTSRRLLLKVALVFTKLHSGLTLTDTHNGLRLLRAPAAAKISLKQLGMAHASELIDQIARHRLRYREVPVKVIYTDYSKAKGQSAFNSFGVIRDLIIGRMMR